MFVSIITVLDFNLYSLQNTCGLCISCPQRWKSLAALGEVTDILKVFSNHVCYNTQRMLKFQVMNFLYVTLLTPKLLKWPQAFWKICGPQPQCVHVIHPFSRTCENNMQSLWCVMINCFAENWKALRTAKPPQGRFLTQSWKTEALHPL